MKNTTPQYKVRIGLLIETTENPGSYGSYYHVTAHPVTIGKTVWEQRWTADHPNETPASYARITDETIRNCGDDLVNGLRLGNFQVNSQGENDATPRRLYAWDIRYRDLYAVELHDAAAMHKTLKTIHSRLDKLNTKYGHPSTFAGYIARVADAISADAFVFARGKGTGWHHSTAYQFESISNGVFKIDRLIQEWIDAGQSPSDIASTRTEATS